MKHLKKIGSLFLALVMILAMSVSVYAGNITIKNGANGSEYAAYKLLNATDGGAGKFSYTVNDKYRSVLEKVTSKTKDSEIVSYISELDATALRAFADEIYANIKNMSAEKTTDSDTFADVEPGYYLIAETKLGNAEDTYSLVMLDTAGNENCEVKTKEDKPTLVKKLKEKNDSTGQVTDWQDGADYDVNDVIPFKLTGTVSNLYDSYKTYYYAFHDVMSAGLTFDETSVVVKVDGVEISTNQYSVKTNNLKDGCTFEVVFDDLKKVGSVKSNSAITVEYNATLNDKAVIGSVGNPNKAKLEYNNNPYASSKPDKPGETPWDTVIVFTYKLIANKVDGQGNALNGAGFTLYKFDFTKNDYVAVGNEITGVTTFTFERLDAGKYKLVETTVPAGYNKAEDLEFTVEATYDTDAADPKFGNLVVKDSKGNIISNGENKIFTTNLNEGSASTTIKNLSGSELPSTGGIGTTIFYVVGVILMLGAGVLLVTKKRMSSNR